MTGWVQGLVRDRVIGDATLKRVLERLAWYSDDDGTSIYPAVATVAQDCGLSERSVQRTLRKAEKIGLLTLQDKARHHRARIYRIDLQLLLAYPMTEVGEARLARQTATIKQGRQDVTPDEKQGRQDVTPDEKQGRQDVTPVEARGDIEAARGDIGAGQGRHPVTQIVKDQLENSKSARAAEASAGRPASTTPADQKGEDLAAPASAQWRANEAAIRASVPQEQWRAWLQVLTPISDDGETLVLAAHTRFIAEYAKEHFGEILEDILGRRLRIEVRRWAAQAAEQRRQPKEKGEQHGPETRAPPG